MKKCLQSRTSTNELSSAKILLRIFKRRVTHPAWALWCLGIWLISIQPNYCLAGPLKEVQTSDAMRHVTRNAKLRTVSPKNNQSGLIGIDEESTLTSIWRTDKGPALLAQWLGVALPHYDVSPIASRRSRTFAQATTTITSAAQISVAVTIIVPHPTFQPLAEHQALAELLQFEPPALAATLKEKISLQGTEGVLYEVESKNSCSVVTKTTQLGVVNLSVKSCRDKEQLIAVAKALDFERLNRKLGSLP